MIFLVSVEINKILTETVKNKLSSLARDHIYKGDKNKVIIKQKVLKISELYGFKGVFLRLINIIKYIWQQVPKLSYLMTTSYITHPPQSFSNFVPLSQTEKKITLERVN